MSKKIKIIIIIALIIMAFIAAYAIFAGSFLGFLFQPQQGTTATQKITAAMNDILKPEIYVYGEAEFAEGLNVISMDEFSSERLRNSEAENKVLIILRKELTAEQYEEVNRDVTDGRYGLIYYGEKPNEKFPDKRGDISYSPDDYGCIIYYEGDMYIRTLGDWTLTQENAVKELRDSMQEDTILYQLSRMFESKLS